MKALILIVLAMVGSLAANAATLSEDYLDNSEIESISILPIKHIKKITFKDGVVVYASDNLRYIFDGEFKDNWLGNDTENLNEYKVNGFEGSGVSPDDISIHYGNGKEVRYVFVAPECLECKSLISQLLNEKLLKSTYTFKIILLSSSSRGFDINTAIWCSKDRLQRLVKVYDGGKSIENANNAKCNPLALMTGNTVAEAFGISKLPAVMDHRGVVLSGKSELIISELK